MTRPFLTARWESLAILNYALDPALLAPLVPRGTTLDLWRGTCFASLVGFRFADTRVLGVAVPWHRHFDEVNLRFYVQRQAADGSWRRGVVFVRELVPRRAIALVARAAYNEPYLAVPMTRTVALSAETGGSVRYGWRFRGQAYTIDARVDGPAQDLVPGSEAAFITEHYWGYTRQRDGGTLEYHVEHPPWRLWSAAQAAFSGPAEPLYGRAFGQVLAHPPASAFVAVGSPVVVHRGIRVERPAYANP